MANVTFAYPITQASAVIPNSFPIGDGVVGVEPTGALVPRVLQLAVGVFLVTTQGATQAVLAAAALAFAQASGLGHDGPGLSKSRTVSGADGNVAAVTALTSGWSNA